MSKHRLLVGGIAVLAAMLTLSGGPPKVDGQVSKETPDRIQAGDRLYIVATGTLPDSPVRGVYRVEPSGKVALGPYNGRVQVRDLSLEEAEVAVHKHLRTYLKDSMVLLTSYDPVAHGGASDRAVVLELHLENLEKEVAALRAAVDKLQKK